jgi:DNA-binding MarR family transcriptional regulator
MEDLFSEPEVNLVSSLSMGGRRELDYVKAVGDLCMKYGEGSSKVNNKAIGKRVKELRESKSNMASAAVEKRAERLEKEGTVKYTKTNSQGKSNFHELTDKGWKLYEAIQPLYQNLDEIEDAVRKVMNEEYIETSLHQVEVELGRSISRSTLLQALNRIKQGIEEKRESDKEGIEKVVKESEEEMERLFEELDEEGN